MKVEKSRWFTYIVLCSDQTLYTGIAVDLEKRIDEHNSGKGGAKYTRSRRPVQLVHFEEFSTRSEATKREFELKKMDRKAKMRIIKDKDT